MVVNTHFDHTSAEARSKQADVLVKFLKSVTDYPIVLTGDFNCEATTGAYAKVISGGVVNSSDVADKRINKVATYTNYGAANKIIDFAFVSPNGLAVTSYKVCDERINGDFPSDHHPVLIEYTLLG
jgi:endonuclease/exonuclease/phosphatase family metal-dependent hydrolase